MADVQEDRRRTVARQREDDAQSDALEAPPVDAVVLERGQWNDLLRAVATYTDGLTKGDLCCLLGVSSGDANELPFSQPTGRAYRLYGPAAVARVQLGGNLAGRKQEAVSGEGEG